MLDYKAKMAQERAEREKPKTTLQLMETSRMFAGVCEYTVMQKSRVVCIGKENGIINLTFDEINRLIDELQEIKNEFGGMENV